MSVFVRVVAVLVGLANLAVLAGLNGVVDAVRRGDVTWDYALPVVLAVVVAGLATSEIVLRWFGPSITARRFAPRYGATVFAVCLGGTLMGGLLAFVLTVERVLVPGPPSVPGLILVALYPGLVGAVFGLVLGLAEGAVLALPLAVILGMLRRPRGQGYSVSLSGVSLLCLLMVATIASLYPVVQPQPPPEAPTLGPPNTPPLSCPEYLGEEIGAFGASGDQVSPAFEIIGNQWGYQVNSAGSGSLSIEVLDEDGNAVSSPDEFGDPGGSPGSSTGMAELAFSGTFSLKIDADDGMEYEILVCDETDPNGRNKGELSMK